MLHYNTSNVSAVKMSGLFEDMGIENNAFFLQLYDENLLHVDPFSEDLTEFEKGLIIRECMVNPWYWLREIVRIPTAGTTVRYEFHRGNIALTWALLNDISAFAVWPRQCYKTVSAQCYYAGQTYYGANNITIILLAYQGEIVRKNLQGIKDIRDALPSWLNPFNSKVDKDNEAELKYEGAKNHIIAKSPPKSPDAAKKAGRGFTSQAIWVDEIGFIKYIGSIWDSLRFAYAQASTIAKQAGAQYHRLLTTSAGFLDTDEGKWAYNVLNNCADFTEEFYDLPIDEVKQIIANGSSSGMLNLEFMYYDLGKGDDYWDKQVADAYAESATPEDTLDREVLNKWKGVSLGHPLGQDRISRLETLKTPPKKIIIINDTYTLRLYVDRESFDMNKCLVAGMDLGGNLKGDYSTFVVTDPEDLSTVAVLRSNSQSNMLWVGAIVGIMEDVFPGLILFPERNFNSAVIDLIASYIKNPTKRIYHEKPGVPGIFTSGKIRPVLFGILLRVMIDDHGERIFDKTIIQEIVSLIRQKNGRIDHPQGGHDDTLIAKLLSVYFILHLDAFEQAKYMDTSIILSSMDANGLVVSATSKDRFTLNLKKDYGIKVMEPVHGYSNVQSTNASVQDMIGDKFYDNYQKSKHTLDNTIEEVDSTGEVDADDDDLDSTREVVQKLKENSEVSTVVMEPISNAINGFTRADFTKLMGW